METKEKQKDVNVMLYCRVSSDEQAQGGSLDIQEEQLRRYCREHNYHIIDFDFREDESAKTFEKRPVIQKILKYIRKNKGHVDKLLFLRWDRFTRDIISGVETLKDLLAMGVEPNAIEAPLDYSSETWPLLLGVHIGLAQGDNIKRSKATKDGIRATQEAGRCSNKAPRGYKNVRTSKHSTHVEIDEEKGQIVKQAFQEVAKGLECPCRIRRRVCPNIPESSFLDMLRNKFYIGQVYVKEYRGLEGYWTNGIHEALIDKETFEKVQDVLDGNKKHTPKITGKKLIHPDLYLRKFVICPVCGHALTGAGSKGNGGRYYYYFCSHDHKHLNKRVETMNDKFVQYVGALKPNETVLRLYEHILLDLRDNNSRAKRVEIAKIKKEIEEYHKLIECVEDKFIQDKIDDTQYKKMLNRYNGTIETLENRLNILSDTQNSEIEPKLKYSISLINNMDTFISDAPVETKIKLISSMFPEKIEFDGEKYRTTKYNQVLDLIFKNSNQLREIKMGESENSPIEPISVLRAGVEPAQVSLSVFETDASTDSAIGALTGCKGKKKSS